MGPRRVRQVYPTQEWCIGCPRSRGFRSAVGAVAPGTVSRTAVVVGIGPINNVLAWAQQYSAEEHLRPGVIHAYFVYVVEFRRHRTGEEGYFSPRAVCICCFCHVSTILRTLPLEESRLYTAAREADIHGAFGKRL